MRERPSITVELRRFGVWRHAVLVIAALAVAAMAAWGALAVSSRTGGSTWIGVVAAMLAVVAVLLARSLMRVDAGTLSCVDGVWTFTFESDGIERIESGDLAVALDLGSFLLLILTRIHGSNRLARRWLPVQRRGLESGWHALRCAVYSPPPVVSDPAAAHGPLPE